MPEVSDPVVPSLFGRIRHRLSGGLREFRTTRDYRTFARSSAGAESAAVLARLKGVHAGRRAFVIGNGPSLNQLDLRLLRNEVTVGCNGLFLAFDRMAGPPTYYTVEDVLVAEDRAKELTAVTGCVKVAPFDVRRFLDGGGFAFCNFVRRYAGIPRLGWEFDRASYWGGTVTFFNLQLAAYLGCDPLILIGVDHDYATNFNIKKEGKVWTSQEADRNHFDPRYFGTGYRWHDPAVDMMERAYHAAKAATDARGVRILNATAGGKLEVFPRVSFESLF